MIQKIQMYILSLWLLFLLVAVKEYHWENWNSGLNWKENFLIQLRPNMVPFFSILFLLLGVFFFVRFRYRTKGSTKLPKEILKIEDQNYEHLTFLTIVDNE
jgi:hypothetical protein